MKKRDQNSTANWRERKLAIRSADGLEAKARDYLAADRLSLSTYPVQLKKAAIFLEVAARAYRQGSLGLMARQVLAEARECYEALGDNAGTFKCDRLLKAIPLHWDDESFPSPPPQRND